MVRLPNRVDDGDIHRDILLAWLDRRRGLRLGAIRRRAVRVVGYRRRRIAAAANLNRDWRAQVHARRLRDVRRLILCVGERLLLRLIRRR